MTINSTSQKKGYIQSGTLTNTIAGNSEVTALVVKFDKVYKSPPLLSFYKKDYGRFLDIYNIYVNRYEIGFWLYNKSDSELTFKTVWQVIGDIE